MKSKYPKDLTDRVNDLINERLQNQLDNMYSRMARSNEKFLNQIKRAESLYPLQQPQKPQVTKEVVVINEISQFTNETHKIEYNVIDDVNDTEIIHTKLVGVDDVDWWEYILFYGFIKALWIGYEYNRKKNQIKVPVETTNPVRKKAMMIYFTPRHQQPIEVNIEGVVKLCKYSSLKMNLPLDYERVKNTREYKKGFFIYEETIDTIRSLPFASSSMKERIAQILDANNAPKYFKNIIFEHFKM